MFCVITWIGELNLYDQYSWTVEVIASLLTFGNGKPQICSKDYWYVCEDELETNHWCLDFM